MANAGSSQSIAAGSPVTLDGSASSDVNGDPLTYSWALSTVPSGSAAALTGPSSAKPSFVPDNAGTYVATLVVNDGKLDSAEATVTITVMPAAGVPTASAGSNQSVVTGATVTLDGSGSVATGANPLTYSWALTNIPPSSTAVLSGANSVKPTFVADVAGSYLVSLVVSDGTSSSLATTVTVTAATGNAPPAAGAGPAQNVLTGATVTLDGTGSFDANGDPLTYAWTLTSKPAGSAAALTGATTAKPTFAADAAGTYVASLVVNDGKVSSSAASVTITAAIGNVAPVANAGPAQNVFTGALVQLDGSGSHDANGDSVTFSWVVISAPAGSTVPAILDNSPWPKFVADLAGTYVIRLVLNDGTVNSAPATVTVTATAPPPVELYLYSGEASPVYLGCLTCNQFHAESVCNKFGTYGSEFSSLSTWNQFGNYGSQFSTYSPWNQFSSSGPAIWGSDGLFYGYLTTNSFRFNRTTIPALVNVLNFYSSTGNLATTRTYACGN